MPIDYTHGSPGLYALAANRAGAGQAARRDEERRFEEALQLARLAEQQRQFNVGADQRQQTIDYGQQNARRNYNLNLYNQFNQNAQLNAGRQFQWALNDQQFQQGLAAKDFQNQLGQQNLELQYDLIGQRDLANQAAQRKDMQFEASIQAADSADQEARARLSEYRRLPLNEQGQQTLSEFSGRIRRLQGQRASINPAEYSKAMGELLQEMDEVGINDFAEQQPTIQSMMEGGQLWKDPETGDWWGIEYRNGQAVPRMFKGSDTAKDPTKEGVDTPFGKLTPKEANAAKNDLVKRARDQLVEEAIPQNGTSPAKYPKKEEIIKRARELMEIEQELFGGESSGGSASPEFVSLQEADQANHVGEFTIKGKRFWRDEQGQVSTAD